MIGDTEREVVAADRAWEDAISRVDVASLRALASEHLIYTHAGGTVEDKAGFIDHIVNGRLRFPSISYEDIQVRCQGSAAVLTCALHLDAIDGDDNRSELHFRVTHVWVREDGQWRLLANQSTHLPVPSAAAGKTGRITK